MPPSSSTPFWKEPININFRRWVFLNLLAVIVGIIGAFTSIFLRWGIKTLSDFLFNVIAVKYPLIIGNYNFTIMLFPMIGGFIVGYFIFVRSPESKGTGIGDVLEGVTLRGGNLKQRAYPYKLAGAIATLGMGGSGGGPIEHIGAIMGSTIGQWAKLHPQEKRIFVAAGIAAGVSATFSAPVGASLFAIELVTSHLHIFTGLPIFIAAVTADFVVKQVGYETNIAFHAIKDYPLAYGLNDVQFLIIFGILMGLLAYLWDKIFFLGQKWFNQMKINNKMKPVIGGAITGLILVFFPTYGLGGVGYENGTNWLFGTNDPLINSIGFLFLLGFLKIITSTSTIGSGACGGAIAPNLYMGCMFGGSIGLIFESLVPGLTIDHRVYAVLGMAAMFGSATQMPLNMMFVIVEMSGNVLLFIPLMISTTAACLISRFLLRGTSLFTTGLELKGIPIKAGSLFSVQTAPIADLSMAQNQILGLNDMQLSKIDEFAKSLDINHFKTKAVPAILDGHRLGQILVVAPHYRVQEVLDIMADQELNLFTIDRNLDINDTQNQDILFKRTSINDIITY